MKRTMIPMPKAQPRQIINPERQKKKYLMKLHGLKTGKQYRRYKIEERRKEKINANTLP